ncbi:ABC transporter permease [Pajaroellobacter abortibovis]|uniref:ABC3 transporter permease protein domain-containing protein n=1 Tax=Pajaroellobacter abortibovis TaxID=1882918 RepID=A0A1L6MVH1_9BACT|nr:ABC transporter permease [Pajaroellobacter abortibovis]APR99478.1 hypothetical protein BCY86_01370 [Pajaroellobacter abortibovis]
MPSLHYALSLAVRHMFSKKRTFISIGTWFSILGVALGVAALAIVMSVTGGFKDQFREKVLGTNAHVLILKYSIEFQEYHEIMKSVESIPGVIGIAPFLISPMMITHRERTAASVLLKGVDPNLMPNVLDLPKHIVKGNLKELRYPDAKPPDRTVHSSPFSSSSTQKSNSLPFPLTGEESQRPRAFLSTTQEQITSEGSAPSIASPSALVLRDNVPDPLWHIIPPPPPPSGNIVPQEGFDSILPEEILLDTIHPPIDACSQSPQNIRLPGVVVGHTLAEQINVTIGDCAQIASPPLDSYFGGHLSSPIVKQFRVIAIFNAGFDQYDSRFIYTDLYEAQKFYAYGDNVTGIEIKVNDIERAPAIAKEISKALNSNIYHTMDWHELNHNLFTALIIQQIGMSIVLALIIIVATFTVVATLIMIVLDKRKEIALLKAIGAKNSIILRIFLYQGLFIGTMGTVLGLILGALICKSLLAFGFPLDPKVYFVSQLPVNLRINEFLIAGSFALSICIIATLFPALYAARLQPSDGLRAD